MFRIVIFLIFYYPFYNESIINESPEFGLKSKWKGYILQNSSNGLAHKYHFTLEFNSSKSNDLLTGTSLIEMTDESAMFARMEFKGKLENKELFLEETKIIDQNIRQNAYWCLKKIRLKRNDSNHKLILQGFWESEECSGDSDVYLENVLY